MASVRFVSQSVFKASRISSHSARCLHQSSARSSITRFQMPAMSPTMTEGGIASWKKKEGELFVAGDVLLEIETDKATIDVEAQDDGVMGKILVPDGTKGVKVGKLIALLAEEGDDTSNIQVPKEEETKAEQMSSSSTPPPQPQPNSAPAPPPSPESSASHSHIHPTHSRPLFPSVQRILAENGIADANKIKGTGIRGMLTKGDVLAFLGKASNPLGTYKVPPSPIQQAAQSAAPKKVEPKPLDGPAIRQLIVSTMLNNSIKARSLPPSTTSADFDSIIADYLPPKAPERPSKEVVPPAKPSTRSPNFLDGLL
ncbi:pyruvate dehydrogenase x component [Moniliophthora roreri]|uniref:Single hybrid motif-containing protein n=1 Tax=Moniliophthora roreri TaxID=221103 RepID=A0A0W0FEE2_MONRR|nr:pyruvate dehydrogenase x component [Moniliophthora roreri]